MKIVFYLLQKLNLQLKILLPKEASLVNYIKHLRKNKTSSIETISKINEKGTHCMSPAVINVKT